MPREIKKKPKEWLWRTFLWSAKDDVTNAIAIVLLSNMFLFVSALLAIDSLWWSACFCVTRCVAFPILQTLFRIRVA